MVSRIDSSVIPRWSKNTFSWFAPDQKADAMVGDSKKGKAPHHVQKLQIRTGEVAQGQLPALDLKFRGIHMLTHNAACAGAYAKRWLFRVG